MILFDRVYPKRSKSSARLFDSLPSPPPPTRVIVVAARNEKGSFILIQAL